MNDETIKKISGYLPRGRAWPNTFLVDRLSALIGDEAIEYLDVSLYPSPDYNSRTRGRLVVYTTTRVFVQHVEPEEGLFFNLALTVVPRSAIRSLRVAQKVRPEESDYESRQPIEWPWQGQVLLQYDGLEGELELPTITGGTYPESIPPFRAFLPSLNRDLQGR